MVIKIGKILVSIFLLLAATGCNLEVGNPESNLINLGKAQSSIESLDFQLTAKQPCSTIIGDCTAVPIVLADSSGASYRFEMTQARMQLSAIELLPYAAQHVITQVDLMAGTRVTLTQSIESIAVTGLSLVFAGNNAIQSHAFILQGKLLANSGGTVTQIPLQLMYSQAISAATAVNANGGALDSVQFDPSVWFDFSSAGRSASALLANLASGPCSETVSRACAEYTASLAQLISERMSKSLSIKSIPTSQRAVSKSRIGG